MSDRLVSIVMAVYNAAPYVANAIQSILEQDHQRWELLAVDDGSTDGSVEIMRSFDDPRITILSQGNSGVSHARNTALKIMKGDFFCFLDADDMLTPRSLSARLKCFKSDDISFADGGVDVFASDLQRKIGAWRPVRVDDHFASLIRLDGKCFFGPTWMMRNNPKIAYRFDEELTHGEDLFFYMSYAHLGRYAYTNEVILNYRRSSQSAMSNLPGLAKGYSLVRKKMMTLIVKPAVYDRILFELKSRKMVFLSFLKARQLKSALYYLLTGQA